MRRGSLPFRCLCGGCWKGEKTFSWILGQCCIHFTYLLKNTLVKGSEAKFPTKLIWELWRWEQINALCTSTQHLFVFSEALCYAPSPNSSSTALFGRAGISPGGYLTNIFRNNLRGGSHVALSVGTSKHWVLQLLPELTHRSVASVKRGSKWL